MGESTIVIRDAIPRNSCFNLTFFMAGDHFSANEHPVNRSQQIVNRSQRIVK